MNPEPTTCACDAPGLSRRSFLKRAGVVAAATASAPLVSTRLAYAATPTTGDTLVLLSLRGGFDGLSALAPIADPDYRRARPSLAVPTTSAVALDRMFALHPALAPLKPLWDTGSLGAVHAVGAPFASRSHFQAQEELERAAPGSTVRTGWLNRVLGGWGDDPNSLRAAHVGTPVMPVAMTGPQGVMSMNNIKDVHLAGADWTGGKLQTAIAGVRAGVTGPAARSAALTLSAFGAVTTLQGSGYAPGAAYPATPLGDALRDVAQLIKSNTGVRVATIDFGDFDSHSSQGANGEGKMAGKLADLAGSLAAFAKDLGPALGRTSLVTLSEFGRRVAENGSGGTDHGKGGVMFLLGGGLNGGRVHGQWPTLAPAALDDGDLRGTTDYRDVLGEVLVRRCGVGSLTEVFPNHTPAFLGVARQA